MDEYELAYNFFALLTVAANVATVTILGVLIAGKVTPSARDASQRLRSSLAHSGLGLATLVAGTAMAGSLYLSERLHLEPCINCWYQRIAMYSLAVILLIATIRRDWGIRPYAIALAAAGSAVSIYHYMEQRFPSLDSGACDADNPCTLVYVWRFHYISIPFMALSAFALVITILAAARVEPAEALTHDAQYVTQEQP